MKAALQLTAWHGGSIGKKVGGTYGLRFGRLRDTLIEGRPSKIELHLDGLPPFAVNLTEGFCKHCPEVRHPSIREWMLKQGVPMPWPRGEPPRFPVERIARNKFRVAPPW